MKTVGIALTTLLGVTSAFLSSTSSRLQATPIFGRLNMVQGQTISDQETIVNVSPIFDFSKNATDTITKFDRIDDAIMGGISTSVLREVNGKDYATWSGVCRIDGGGFCGFRTLPFVTPINVSSADGLFVDCRLVSDDEPERRVWKMTVRTESGYRGEQVYQAEFDMPKRPSDENGWNRIFVPFENFQLVRGPRLVADGPPIDVSNGLFQIGFTMSKFKIAYNTTELDHFRAGYFDLQIEKIGSFVKDNSKSNVPSDINIETESKEMVKKKRPIIFKVLGPALKFFFSEKSKRRKRAMKLLTKDRGMSRINAIIFGAKVRPGNPVLSILQTIGIITNDVIRTLLFNLLKCFVFYPLSFVGKMLALIRSTVSGKSAPQPQPE